MKQEIKQKANYIFKKYTFLINKISLNYIFKYMYLFYYKQKF